MVKIVAHCTGRLNGNYRVHGIGRVNGNYRGAWYWENYVHVLQNFLVFKQKIMPFVKQMICILYTGSAKTRRFCFVLFQLPLNVTLMVCGEYLFCLTLYCTDYTACNMLKYRKGTAI
jgi:hypothetical protein